MERNNNTTKSRKGKHLTYEERQKLEVLLKAKVERKKIAELLGGRSERTIERGLFLNIGKGDLPQGGKQRKRSYEKVRRANNNPTGTSISERAEEIESRNDFGHWELDTVVGKAKTKAALLVLTERKTRYELIYKLENKTQDAVIAALNKLERKLGANRFRKVFKTITCDNGCENLDHEGMEKSVQSGKRTKVYYAHPYSAWERGSNENANKLIRRFIPKGTDIGKLTRKEIKRIQRWMNDYPRAILDGLSAKMAVLALGQEPADA